MRNKSIDQGDVFLVATKGRALRLCGVRDRGPTPTGRRLRLTRHQTRLDERLKVLPDRVHVLPTAGRNFLHRHRSAGFHDERENGPARCGQSQRGVGDRSRAQI